MALSSPALALDMRPCRSDRDFVCGKLRVPVDRAGRVKGTLSIPVAAQRDYPKDAGLLVALSGGPGQSSVSAAESFAFSLEAALHRYRLVVIDQRGTGEGALQCPELQKIGVLDPYTPRLVQRCAQRIGPRRSHFSTADTVADLEALAARLRRSQGRADGDQLRDVGRDRVRACAPAADRIA